MDDLSGHPFDREIFRHGNVEFAGFARLGADERSTEAGKERLLRHLDPEIFVRRQWLACLWEEIMDRLTANRATVVDHDVVFHLRAALLLYIDKIGSLVAQLLERLL